MTEMPVVVLERVVRRDRARQQSVDGRMGSVIEVDFRERTVSRPATESLPQLLRSAAAAEGSAIALTVDDSVVTVGELAAAMDLMAGAVASCGSDTDSALMMAVMTEVPSLCASGPDGMAAAMEQLRDRLVGCAPSSRAN
ncbi:hypothetical protein [Jongsikchunia kroppenstedtii]|uniref:hypothetical protein n=1 Tax=Jongsikchunia kroppenstedtii TaxID=1121721 RepID=UPI0012DC48CD|nr:hypothetical protein [Jongsikchunia kroppenstedtii]